MANSDNVVRGGRTSNNIDTQMLRKLIRYDQRNISQLEPQRVSDAVVSFQPPVEEFALSVIGLDSGEKHVMTTQGVSLLFSVQCGFTISSDQQKIRVNRGEGVLCAAGEIGRAHV